MCNYVCYIITTPDDRYTYCGITNNPHRRLRQHRGEIVGGARYTSQHGPAWEYLWHVRGFGDDKSSALSFEWHMKRRGKGRSACCRRANRLAELMRRDRWAHLTVAVASRGSALLGARGVVADSMVTDATVITTPT